MLVKELVEYGQVQYHITVIKYRVQAFFDNGHFVSFKVERKELSLLHICKTVQLGKIPVYRQAQHFLDLTSVKVSFVVALKQILIAFMLLEVRNCLRYTSSSTISRKFWSFKRWLCMALIFVVRPL